MLDELDALDRKLLDNCGPGVLMNFWSVLTVKKKKKTGTDGIGDEGGSVTAEGEAVDATPPS